MDQCAIDSDFRVFSKTYVFDPRPNLPFQIIAKRYWMGLGSEKRANANASSKPDSETRGDALTLVLAHAIGFHKEHWEPIIHHLFEQQRRPGACLFKIEDMWSLDAPNHGDAAVINEEVFTFGYHIFSSEDYGRCVHAFLAGLGSGVDVDFSKRNLVAVGHSMGAVAVMLSTSFFPPIKFSSMHIIEPVILGNYGHDYGWHFSVNAEKRRDIWESAEEAYKSLKNRSMWRRWDDRILRIYVEHGLRSLPTVGYPDQKCGVTLKCTKKQEAAAFRDRRSFSIAYRLLPHILKTVPTHITYGETADFLKAEWRDDALNVASGGIGRFASTTHIPGAGHLVAQTHPDVVSNVLWMSLLQTHSSGRLANTTLKARL